MHLSISSIREEWERGLTPLSVIHIPNKHYLVVLQSKAGDYHCHRYFAIGPAWECSVDGQRVSLDTVWKWLSNPSARTCKS